MGWGWRPGQGVGNGVGIEAGQGQVVGQGPGRGGPRGVCVACVRRVGWGQLGIGGLCVWRVGEERRRVRWLCRIG